MKNLFITLILGAICLKGIAQKTFDKDLFEVSRNMEKLKKFSVNLRYTMYLDNNMAKPYQTTSQWLKMDGLKMSLKQDGDFELIETDRERVNISYGDGRVYYSKFQTPQQISDEEHDRKVDALFTEFMGNDSLRMFIEKITVISDKNGLREYEIVYNAGDYTKMRIGVDIHKKVFAYIFAYYSEKRVIPELGQKQRGVCLRLEYKDLNTSPVFDQSEFSVGKIITKGEKEKIGLRQKFQKYKLILL